MYEKKLFLRKASLQGPRLSSTGFCGTWRRKPTGRHGKLPDPIRRNSRSVGWMGLPGGRADARRFRHKHYAPAGSKQRGPSFRALDTHDPTAIDSIPSLA